MEALETALKAYVDRDMQIMAANEGITTSARYQRMLDAGLSALSALPQPTKAE